ncbi:MAG TPA: glycosyltransferase family 9 protein [Humibacter sp.]|nr:glycosyltransferase family 9 protein [Humibacter sp.]
MRADPVDATHAGSGLIGATGERFEGVRRIAVLRGGGLGDVLFAIPAMNALIATYPAAHITLLGTAVHAALLADRPGVPHSVVQLPVAHGVRDGDGEHPAELDRFFAEMRLERFDLAVQLHGGGRFSNPFLLRLGARHTVGGRSEGAAELERTIPYVYFQHEVLRDLEIVALAGAASVGAEPSLQVTAAERIAGSRMRDGAGRGLVAVHPGATDPRRRWPVERFGEVAAALALDGYQVIVIGDSGERRLCDSVVHAADAIAPGRRVFSAAGTLSLSQLVGLLAAADVVVANDSGPRHLAQAVGTPTVGVYWVGNVINAAPLTRARHRVHISWTTHCPVCGRECTRPETMPTRCEHEVSFVADVDVEAVCADARELLAAEPEEAATDDGLRDRA